MVAQSSQSLRSKCRSCIVHLSYSFSHRCLNQRRPGVLSLESFLRAEYNATTVQRMTSCCLCLSWHSQRHLSVPVKDIWSKQYQNPLTLCYFLIRNKAMVAAVMFAKVAWMLLSRELVHKACYLHRKSQQQTLSLRCSMRVDLEKAYKCFLQWSLSLPCLLIGTMHGGQRQRERKCDLSCRDGCHTILS